MPRLASGLKSAERESGPKYKKVFLSALGVKPHIDRIKIAELLKGGAGPTEIAKELGIARPSVYRTIAEVLAASQVRHDGVTPSMKTSRSPLFPQRTGNCHLLGITVFDELV